jgi:hypothetical protein
MCSFKCADSLAECIRLPPSLSRRLVDELSLGEDATTAVCQKMGVIVAGIAEDTIVAERPERGRAAWRDELVAFPAQQSPPARPQSRPRPVQPGLACALSEAITRNTAMSSIISLFLILPLITDDMGMSFDLAAHKRLVDGWKPDNYPRVHFFLPVCGEPLPVLRNTWPRKAPDAPLQRHRHPLRARRLEESATPGMSGLSEWPGSAAFL